MDIPRRTHRRDSGAWVEAMQMAVNLQKQEGQRAGRVALALVIAGTGAVALASGRNAAKATRDYPVGVRWKLECRWVAL